ncbi:MAG: tetratricopeptide repeat protein [Planctomycetia bacterium]|nr:tetratricopeptide repeat protein [Planctomycetia bacterium]
MTFRSFYRLAPIAILYLSTSIGLGLALVYTSAAEQASAADAPAGEDKGQAELDAALDARISAKSFDDLEQVIKQTRKAIEKGLGPTNLMYAKKLLASVFYQRGETLGERVLEATDFDPRVAQARVAAVGDLSEALANDPDLSAAYVLIARLQLLPGGDIKQAKTMLDAAVKSKATDDETRAKALTLRSAFGSKPEERLADLDEAIRLNAGDAQTFRLRAAVKLSTNKAAEAVADFDEALLIAPTHAATHEARGLALAAQEKWEEAKKSLTRAAQLVPQSPAAILQRGRVSLLAGDTKSAIADAEAALKITPDMPEAILLRGRARQAAGDKQGAREDADLLLKRFPDAPGALRSRVALLLDDNKYEESIPDLEKLAKLEPEDDAILLQLAVVRNALKQHAEVIDISNRLLKRDADNWRAMRIRGDAHLNAGKQADAIADYEAALKIEPKDTGILNNLAWVLATSPDDKLRNGKRAIELADKACQLTNHKIVHILSTLAAAYAEEGNFTAAKEWSNKALAAAEGDAEKESLRKELASYEAKKPWREAIVGAVEKPEVKRK